MTKPSILVAGIGNIFFGDDAFGVEVVQRLVERRLPENVRVIDFGIRGLDLTYALLDGYDLVILVDTCQRGDEPGTLCVIEPNLAVSGASNDRSAEIETHGLVPSKALELAGVLGANLGEIRLVSCEPATLETADDGQMGLSAPVKNAIAEALDLIESLIHEFSRRFHA
jgi:hydrogenase maturation protease